MSPAEADAAAAALTTATQNIALTGAQETEASAAQLAPGLSFGANVPGGRNYQAFVAPTVPALTSAFVVNAKQGAFRQALAEAINNAQLGYDAARNAYQARQRAFNQKQAQRSRERQARADAQAAAASRAATSGVGSVNVNSKAPPAVPQRSMQNTAPGFSLQGGSTYNSLQGGSSIPLQGGNYNLQGGSIRVQ